MRLIHQKLTRIGTRMIPYAVAVVMVLVMIGLREFLNPVLGEHHPFILLVFAVLVSAWYGGWKPALFALVLGMPFAVYLFVPPRGSFWVHDIEHQAGLVIYLLVCRGGIFRSESERAAPLCPQTKG